MKRKFSVITTVAMILTVIFPVLSMQATAETGGELQSLAEIYEDYFLLGSIFSPGSNLDTYFDFMQDNFNVLTAENAMKPDATQRSKGDFNFTDTDKALETILDAGIKIHGHTLLWHAQSPDFLNVDVTRAEAEQNLSDHVLTVAGHFAGKVISWDVLNEAMIDGPPEPEDWRSALRRSNWFNAFEQDGGNGEDYIYMAFKLAREADPNAKLYYNDYNLNNPNKAQAVYYMVKELNEMYLAEGNDRLLIEGVGMQGHYGLNTSIIEVEDSIKLFSELGVEISFSELDVGVNGVPESGLSEDDEYWQAVKYAQLFKLFKKYSDVIERVTFWGLNDEITWINGRYPLIFNSDFSQKLSYYAVADPEKFMEENNILDAIEVKQRLMGNAVYGTPEIDGKIDSIWEETDELPVDQMLQAWITADGTAKVIWDEENLYVLIEVVDPILDNSSDISWEKDSVEIYIDERNCKRGSFLSDDSHYRLCFDGTLTIGSNGNRKNFVSSVVKNDSGYIAEMKIPFKVLKPENDTIIGFDVQINDAKNGSRIGIMKWNDSTDNSQNNTSGWGEVKFIGGPAGGFSEVEDTKTSEEDSEDNSEDVTEQDMASINNVNEDSQQGDMEATAVSAEAEASVISIFGIIIIIIIGIIVVAAVVIVIVLMHKKSKKS